MKKWIINKTYNNEVTISAASLSRVDDYFYFYGEQDDLLYVIQAGRVGSIETSEAKVEGHA